MLALGKTGEGAYSQDSDIYTWRPLPTDKCHVGVRSLHFLWLIDRQNSRKAAKWISVWWEPQWCRLEEPDPLLIKGHFMNPLIYRQLKDTFTSSNYYDSKDFITLHGQLWILLTLAAKRRQRVTAITWAILSVCPSITTLVLNSGKGHYTPMSVSE